MYLEEYYRLIIPIIMSINFSIKYYSQLPGNIKKLFHITQRET